MTTAITVTQLNRYVKLRLEEDEPLKDLLLSGEISNLTNHYSSGHIYFVLKDAGAAVRAVMFRSNAQRLIFAPSNGMQVLARCTVSLYERDGSYQVYVRELHPDGAGTLYIAYEQLKARLEAEGLFAPEHKRSLPRYPRVIGIVTSPTGAALQDMLNIIGRRWPLCRVLISKATVQGDGAARTVIDALHRLAERGDCDIILVGRGGGSIEDLWAFNDEALARAVYACPVPVISAVGHETDFTICDFVADLRAPTPSAAAELAVPDQREVMQRLSDLEQSMLCSARHLLERCTVRLAHSERRIIAFSPQNRLKESARRLEACRLRMAGAVRRSWNDRQTQLQALIRLSDSLSPLTILSRGYGVVMKGTRAVRSVEQLAVGETFCVHLADGEVQATAVHVKNQEEGIIKHD